MGKSRNQATALPEVRGLLFAAVRSRGHLGLGFRVCRGLGFRVEGIGTLGFRGLEV